MKPTRQGAAIHTQEEASIGDSLMVVLVEDSGLANGEGNTLLAVTLNRMATTTSSNTRGSAREETEHDHTDLMQLGGSSSQATYKLWRRELPKHQDEEYGRPPWPTSSGITNI